MEGLIEGARVRGIRKLRFTLLYDNAPMRRMIEAAVGPYRVVETDGPVVTVEANVPVGLTDGDQPPARSSLIVGCGRVSIRRRSSLVGPEPGHDGSNGQDRGRSVKNVGGERPVFAVAQEDIDRGVAAGAVAVGGVGRSARRTPWILLTQRAADSVQRICPGTISFMLLLVWCACTSEAQELAQAGRDAGADPVDSGPTRIDGGTSATDAEVMLPVAPTMVYASTRGIDRPWYMPLQENGSLGEPTLIGPSRAVAYNLPMGTVALSRERTPGALYIVAQTADALRLGRLRPDVGLGGFELLPLTIPKIGNPSLIASADGQTLALVIGRIVHVVEPSGALSTHELSRPVEWAYWAGDTLAMSNQDGLLFWRPADGFVSVVSGRRPTLLGPAGFGFHLYLDDPRRLYFVSGSSDSLFLLADGPVPYVGALGVYALYEETIGARRRLMAAAPGLPPQQMLEAQSFRAVTDPERFRAFVVAEAPQNEQGSRLVEVGLDGTVSILGPAPSSWRPTHLDPAGCFVYGCEGGGLARMATMPNSSAEFFQFSDELSGGNCVVSGFVGERYFVATRAQDGFQVWDQVDLSSSIVVEGDRALPAEDGIVFIEPRFREHRYSSRDIEGGAPRAITDWTNGTPGAHWLVGNELIYQNEEGGLSAVSVAGGESRSISDASFGAAVIGVAAGRLVLRAPEGGALSFRLSGEDETQPTRLFPNDTVDRTYLLGRIHR